MLVSDCGLDGEHGLNPIRRRDGEHGAENVVRDLGLPVFLRRYGVNSRVEQGQAPSRVSYSEGDAQGLQKVLWGGGVRDQAFTSLNQAWIIVVVSWIRLDW